MINATDRKLLELAAKAAGVELIQMPPGVYRNATGAKPENNAFGLPTWNPITDDGDALRLAHAVPMIVTPGTARLLDGRLFGKDNKDIAATRRAIVRAAAEIGRNMK